MQVILAQKKAIDELKYFELRHESIYSLGQIVRKSIRRSTFKIKLPANITWSNEANYSPYMLLALEKVLILDIYIYLNFTTKTIFNRALSWLFQQENEINVKLKKKQKKETSEKFLSMIEFQ